MIKRNPKQEGSNLWDCKTQVGNCPMNCNQCFANRPGAAYIPMDEQILPTVEEVGDGIVRANCLHDSNLGREELIEHCKRYKKVFYNTSVRKFDFPGPVVFTANPKEEEYTCRGLSWPSMPFSNNLMFVRLRVSTSNLNQVENLVRAWTEANVPVVLTFMAYYEEDKIPSLWFNRKIGKPLTRKVIDETDHEPGSVPTDFLCYVKKVRHINSYWCPTKEFMVYVLKRMKKIGGRLVTMCSTSDSYYCRDCCNCETYYYQTMKHMKEIGNV